MKEKLNKKNLKLAQRKYKFKDLICKSIMYRISVRIRAVRAGKNWGYLKRGGEMQRTEKTGFNKTETENKYTYVRSRTYNCENGCPCGKIHAKEEDRFSVKLR
jgi:hypothetical protein